MSGTLCRLWMPSDVKLASPVSLRNLVIQVEQVSLHPCVLLVWQSQSILEKTASHQKWRLKDHTSL